MDLLSNESDPHSKFNASLVTKEVLVNYPRTKTSACCFCYLEKRTKITMSELLLIEV